jgi:hypothetical protein
MPNFYLAMAHVYPGRDNRILVHTHIFREQASTCPAPSLVSFGNFHTLRRYFPTQAQAEQWTGYLRSTFTQGPVCSDGQLTLFQEVSK